VVLGTVIMNRRVLIAAISLFIALTVLNLPAAFEKNSTGMPGEFPVATNRESIPGINPVDQFRLSYPNFQHVLDHEPAAKPFLPIVREAVKSTRDVHPVDPLLALALIKHESAFKADAVSGMGAGGPMQFMPSTARDMGLDPVYAGTEYEKGRDLHVDSRGYLSRAIGSMKRAEYDRMKRYVKKWKELSTKADVLLDSYQQTLRQRVKNKSTAELKTIDQRFVPELAVPAGVNYLSRMLDNRDGDFREALAAYNAGPGNVSRYRGIPPFNETVNYQNRIINTYREYRELALTPEDPS